jgi:hypothetical protein
MSAVCPSVLAKKTGTSQRIDSASVCAMPIYGASHVPQGPGLMRPQSATSRADAPMLGESRAADQKKPAFGSGESRRSFSRRARSAC